MLEPQNEEITTNYTNMASDDIVVIEDNDDDDEDVSNTAHETVENQDDVPVATSDLPDSVEQNVHNVEGI